MARFGVHALHKTIASTSEILFVASLNETNIGIAANTTSYNCSSRDYYKTQQSK